MKCPHCEKEIEVVLKSKTEKKDGYFVTCYDTGKPITTFVEYDPEVQGKIVADYQG